MTSTTLTPRSRAKSDYLNLTLWTFQGWIAMFFIAAGYAKLTESMENLTVLMHWPAMASVNFVRGLGVVEMVLALMVLSPLVSWRFGRPLLLTASVGLLALQTIMLILHAMELNVGLALTNLFLIAITAPVLWFRRH
ncbi:MULTISPECIES: DoxX family protein [unclassified Brevundimonas]|uniref:DoxX family protein n=1 Tax=unclassified Brevundimonas TaxID=2622653 RepID=UPI000CFABEAE|nr:MULTISPECIES: DoxX family protein [unclassified Brevundimonas]PRA31741.1 doxX family protein [Brevundimonas sp. MYb27]PQZ83614.1 doxX family protein [Brevundimonas sp. MYb31]PRB15798.1 doxX family protein [Brevundimonas sp. MYb52]PRB36294.1 doxX family protein [Brevundimonas sp. MYb46]PRB46978.1 doxX family protein [Brevundimonas sp. MYb33]